MDLESQFWGFQLRFGQMILEAALTIVIGVVVAGVLRRMVGPAGTRKLFGRGWKGLLRGWLAGMLLPVCSLGVIPVARELRRAGVPGGTVLAFALAAPLLNPISFLYGLTLAEPIVILTFSGLSLVLSTLAGWLWDRIFASSDEAEATAARAARADAEPLPAIGPKRLLAVGITAARELSGRDFWFYLLGWLGSARLSSLIPYGALQASMLHSQPWSPLHMTGLAIPIFSSPLPGMMKIGLMFDHGNSIGAAFVLFTLGIGLSIGTLIWLGDDFGWRRTPLWFLSYVAIIVGMAFAAERLLYDTRKAELDHTHAFDDYSMPFPPSTPDLPRVTATKLEEKFGPLERPAVYALAGLAVIGLGLRLGDRRGQLERWLTTQPDAARPRSRFDVIVPGPVLGAISLLGLVAFSVIGAFVYYPDREQCRTLIIAVYTDAAVAVRTNKPEEAIRHIEQLDLLIRKLEVGVLLRSWKVTPEQSSTAANLREALESMRDHCLANELAAAQQAYLREVEPAYRALKQAYTEP